MAQKRTRLTIPKQIRHEVKTILQYAPKNNGIRGAVVLFVNNRGELHGVGNTSGILRQVTQQAVDNFNFVVSTARQAFTDGWSCGEQAQKKTA